MPVFMITRQGKPEDLFHHLDHFCKLCCREGRARWQRCWVSGQQGRLFCEWEAPDRATMEKVLAEAGLAYDEMIEVETMGAEECDWKVFGDLED